MLINKEKRIIIDEVTFFLLKDIDLTSAEGVLAVTHDVCNVSQHRKVLQDRGAYDFETIE